MSRTFTTQAHAVSRQMGHIWRDGDFRWIDYRNNPNVVCTCDPTRPLVERLNCPAPDHRVVFAGWGATVVVRDRRLGRVVRKVHCKNRSAKFRARVDNRAARFRTRAELDPRRDVEDFDAVAFDGHHRHAARWDMW